MMKDTEYYNSISMDSMSWLENSKKLKFSADLIQKELDKLIRPFINGIFDYSKEDEIVALWKSYFLVIGFAFENLIKGLSIESHKEVLSFKEIMNSYWKKHDNGHGISEIAKDNLNDLSDEEIDLLKRLEKYIVWAGRYPTSKNESRFISDKASLIYKSNDPKIINSLFQRMKNKLLEIWEKNDKKNGY